MQYCENGDLSQYMKKQMGKLIKQNIIWKFFIEMCEGLSYLHSLKVLHRDIKTLNIFLAKDNSVRIGDLGVAKVLSHTANFAKTMVGTPYYLSPELCQEKPYNTKSDVWALGCVLYELCAHRHPFSSTNQGALILKIIKGKFQPIPKEYSKQLGNVVSLCLTRDHRKRPNVKDLLQLPIILEKKKSLNIQRKDASTIVHKPYFDSAKTKLQQVKRVTQQKSQKIQKQQKNQKPIKPNYNFKQQIKAAPIQNNANDRPKPLQQYPKPVSKVPQIKRRQSSKGEMQKKITQNQDKQILYRKHSSYSESKQQPVKKSNDNNDPKVRIRKGAPTELARAASKPLPSGNLYKKLPEAKQIVPKNNIKVFDHQQQNNKNLKQIVYNSNISSNARRVDVQMVKNLPNPKINKQSSNIKPNIANESAHQQEINDDDFMTMFQSSSPRKVDGKEEQSNNQDLVGEKSVRRQSSQQNGGSIVQSKNQEDYIEKCQQIENTDYNDDDDDNDDNDKQQEQQEDEQVSYSKNQVEIQFSIKSDNNLNTIMQGTKACYDQDEGDEIQEAKLGLNQDQQAELDQEDQPQLYVDVSHPSFQSQSYIQQQAPPRMTVQDYKQSLKQDIKKLKSNVLDLDKKKKSLIRQAHEMVSEQKFEEIYSFFMEKSQVIHADIICPFNHLNFHIPIQQKQQLSKKDEQQINELIYLQNLPEILTWTLMKLSKIQVDRARVGIELDEKQNQLKDLKNFK